MLYEIWSLGYKPFETLATNEVCVYNVCTINVHIIYMYVNVRLNVRQ